ncbi:MAG: N-acetylmuramoyl-L-alanine amidase [Saprospiraceae bacterium]|nr:N-acetylmuramoyl-L-alanine amidase [Saprospiraceae bacterium]
MLTTTLVAIQTFFCTSLPPATLKFNTSLESQPLKSEEILQSFEQQRQLCNPITLSPHHSITPSSDKGIKQCEIEEADYRIKTIVIDPGHGGHDPGCLGVHNHEKNLALAIAKKAATYISTQFPEVRVIMTRETDVFIPLHERTRIANQNNADLFISIHCNYMPGSRATSGTETYVMGLHTAEQNLEVAKRENSAILLEENYEQNYDFDPNSTEGHIMLSMFQNAYLEQSILFAERVEEKFATQAGRRSRGVKQAGFYVLKATTMPSILIEAGFLSNREEENFLSTGEGQDIAANAILQAFAEYKSIVESGRINTETTVVSQPPPTKQPQVVRVVEQTNAAYTPSAQDRAVRHEPKIIPSGPINEAPRKNDETGSIIQFCVQIAAATQPVDANQSKWQVLRYQVEVVQEDNFYKYQARGFYDLESALQAKTYLKSKGFPDAFVVAYKNGKKIALEDAKKELGIKY